LQQITFHQQGDAFCGQSGHKAFKKPLAFWVLCDLFNSQFKLTLDDASALFSREGA
jgi:hypothetical protein